MSEIAERTPAQQLVATVNGPEFRREVGRALPENISVDRFIRVITTALMQSPEIGECEPDSIFRALLKCAQDGLLPDGREAAIAPFKDNKTGTKQATYLPMIGGLRKKLAEFGWSLRTRVVYTNDEFSYEYGIKEHLTHRPPPPGTKRGDRIAVYAVASHRDGRKEFTVMSADEVEKVRKLAKTQNVWERWPDQMWEKSAGHQLADDVPLDPNERDAIKRLIKADELALEPGAATEMLYGPQGQKLIELQRDIAADVAEHRSMTLEQAAEALAGLAPEATEADGGGQGEGDQQPSSMGEERSGGDADALPSTDGFDDETIAAADLGGEYVPPSGTYSKRGPKGPRSLAEIAQEPSGKAWIAGMLARTLEPAEYKEAVWAFARVYLPEAFAKAAGA